MPVWCCDGGVPDEVLNRGPRPPWAPGWVRVLLAVLVLLAATVFAIVRAGPHSRAAAAGGRSASAASAIVSVPSPSSSPARQWPHAAGACGSDWSLPIVSAVPLTTHTGLQVLLGGTMLRTVDLDSGRVTAVPGAALRGDESVTQLAVSGSDSYALASYCRGAHPARVIRVGPNGRADLVATGQLDDLLADDIRVWALTYPLDDTTPWANLRLGYLLAVGAGMLVWSDACPQPTVCTLHRRGLSDRGDHRYLLPAGRRPSSFAVVSPDGRLLAFLLQRAAADPRYDPGHPQPPADIALLDLDTSQLQIVPGLEFAPKTQPGLVFSPDSRWLVIALNEALRTRLLVWTPGLGQPMQSRAELPGQLALTPPIAILPPRG